MRALWLIVAHACDACVAESQDLASPAADLRATTGCAAARCPCCMRACMRRVRRSAAVQHALLACLCVLCVGAVYVCCGKDACIHFSSERTRWIVRSVDREKLRDKIGVGDTVVNVQGASAHVVFAALHST